MMFCENSTKCANKSSIYVICHVFGRFNYPKISIFWYIYMCSARYSFGCGEAIDGAIVVVCLKKVCYAHRFSSMDLQRIPNNLMCLNM